MKKLILCDFDGTISTYDMGYILVNHFSSDEWKAIDQDFCDGKIGSKEAYSRIASLLKGDKKAAIDFIQKHSDIDPYFSSFYKYCKENHIDVKIVSDGLDFYIRILLGIHHLTEIPFYANTTQYLSGGGLDISFPYSNAECGLCGTCKRKIIQLHRADYDAIYFVGNGLSDRCAAAEADFVFAKDSLYPFCIEKEITCHYFQSFSEILADLKKRIHGIIFDLDGTLIEAYEAIYLGLEEAFRQSGKEMFHYSDLKKYLKADLESTLLQFFSPEEAQKNVPIMRKKYAEVYIDHTHFLDGAKEVIETLHARGVRMAIASNKFGRFSREALVHLGVSQYFNAVFGAGDVPRNKPFPDMVHASLKEMNLPPEEAIYVGDTLTDIEAGKEAGVDVYALPTGFHSREELSQMKPKRILKTLKELLLLHENLFYQF